MPRVPEPERRVGLSGAPSLRTDVQPVSNKLGDAANTLFSKLSLANAKKAEDLAFRERERVMQKAITDTQQGLHDFMHTPGTGLANLTGEAREGTMALWTDWRDKAQGVYAGDLDPEQLEGWRKAILPLFQDNDVKVLASNTAAVQEGQLNEVSEINRQAHIYADVNWKLPRDTRSMIRQARMAVDRAGAIHGDWDGNELSVEQDKAAAAIVDTVYNAALRNKDYVRARQVIDTHGTLLNTVKAGAADDRLQTIEKREEADRVAAEKAEAREARRQTEMLQMDLEAGGDEVLDFLSTSTYAEANERYGGLDFNTWAGAKEAADTAKANRAAADLEHQERRARIRLNDAVGQYGSLRNAVVNGAIDPANLPASVREKYSELFKAEGVQAFKDADAQAREFVKDALAEQELQQQQLEDQEQEIKDFDRFDRIFTFVSTHPGELTTRQKSIVHQSSHNLPDHLRSRITAALTARRERDEAPPNLKGWLTAAAQADADILDMVQDKSEWFDGVSAAKTAESISAALRDHVTTWAKERGVAPSPSMVEEFMTSDELILKLQTVKNLKTYNKFIKDYLDATPGGQPIVPAVRDGAAPSSEPDGAGFPVQGTGAVDLRAKEEAFRNGETPAAPTGRRAPAPPDLPKTPARRGIHNQPTPF